MKVFKKFSAEAARIISRGGIGVIPTDTIYGIVCSALSKKSVERVYRLRSRNPKKPVIVLIGSARDLEKFGVTPSTNDYKLLANLWPGKVSVILELRDKRHEARDKFNYLHRGKKEIAFRMPANAKLRRFLKKTGPLIAPSANFEGRTPATTVKEAQKYFGEKIDFYVDGGKLKSKPSTLVSIKGGRARIIRAGAAKIISRPF